VQEGSGRELEEMTLGRDDPHAGDRDAWAGIESAPLFTGISSEEFRRIAAAARLKRFARGEMLYWEGEPVEQALLLISGLVKITQVGQKSMEVILRLSAPGDVLDAVGLFSVGRHYTTARAMRGCVALAWPAGTFKDLVERLPVLHQNMIRFICGYLQDLEQRFRELATERVASRVARQLIRLQEQAGVAQNREVEIGVSLEGLAQMTGTTLYTVSRLLSAWETQGLVICRRGCLTINDVRTLRKVFEEN
jgi:CRP/FNR family transcriptional regulator, nitrogen oxide reductase regulator